MDAFDLQEMIEAPFFDKRASHARTDKHYNRLDRRASRWGSRSRQKSSRKQARRLRWEEKFWVEPIED